MTDIHCTLYFTLFTFTDYCYLMTNQDIVEQYLDLAVCDSLKSVHTKSRPHPNASLNGSVCHQIPFQGQYW